MDADILLFDSKDPLRNRRCFQYFIEKHFSYYGDEERQTPISRVSRHFSEAKGLTYRERFLHYISQTLYFIEFFIFRYTMSTNQLKEQ